MTKYLVYAFLFFGIAKTTKVSKTFMRELEYERLNKPLLSSEQGFKIAFH